MRLPSLKTVFTALAAITAVVIVVIAVVAGLLLGSVWWAVAIGAVLLLLGLPPVFVAQHEVERIVRQRRARAFRGLGEGRGFAFGASERETTA